MPSHKVSPATFGPVTVGTLSPALGGEVGGLKTAGTSTPSRLPPRVWGEAQVIFWGPEITGVGSKGRTSITGAGRA